MLKFLRCLLLMIGMGACAPIIHLEQELAERGSQSIPEPVNAPKTLPIEFKALPHVISEDPDSWTEHECLSRNIYWESKGQGERGMKLVAQVTINRVNSDRKYFPNNICQVVKQKLGKSCSYSWYCDGKSDKPKEPDEFNKAKRIAQEALDGKYSGLTKALYFKRCSIVSEFFNKLKYLGKENDHCFYKEWR